MNLNIHVYFINCVHIIHLQRYIMPEKKTTLLAVRSSHLALILSYDILFNDKKVYTLLVICLENMLMMLRIKKLHGKVRVNYKTYSLFHCRKYRKYLVSFKWHYAPMRKDGM